MNNYQPKPGTIPARLIEHLMRHGGTMTRPQIANGFAVESKNVHGNLATVIKHGLIVMHQVEGQKTCYGLPGSAPEVTAPMPPASMTLATSSNHLLMERKTPKKKERAPAAVAPVAAAPVEPEEAPPPPHRRLVGGRRLRAVRLADQCGRHGHDQQYAGTAGASLYGAGLRTYAVMVQPIIIALTGLAGAGKDTIADTLVTHAGFRKIAFADALRLEVAGAFNLGVGYILTERDAKELPSNSLRLARCNELPFIERMYRLASVDQPDFDYDEWGSAPRSPRQIMQWWGTEYRRHQEEGYWTNRVVMRILSTVPGTRWVVTDCRFANEARAIRSVGGELWQVTRPGQKSVEGGHASENDGTYFKPEAVLINGSTVIALMHSALRMLQHRHGGLILPDDLEAAA